MEGVWNGCELRFAEEKMPSQEESASHGREGGGGRAPGGGGGGWCVGKKKQGGQRGLKVFSKIGKCKKDRHLERGDTFKEATEGSKRENKCSISLGA